MTNAERTRRVSEHYEHAILDLVEAHAKLAHSPLALAVRFRFDDPLDVHLLEVIANFPGDDEDPPFTSEFAPNERFLILGKLHLTLASPRQLEHAIGKARARKSPSDGPKQTALRAMVREILKDGRIVYQAQSPSHLANVARKAKTALGLG